MLEVWGEIRGLEMCWVEWGEGGGGGGGGGGEMSGVGGVKWVVSVDWVGGCVGGCVGGVHLA